MGGTDTEIIEEKKKKKKKNGEENFPAAPAGTQTYDLSITSPAF